MAIIQNAATIREVRTVAGLSLSEGFPQRLGDTILPVVNINPKDYRFTNVVSAAGSATSGNLTVYTTPSDKDFYLTAVELTVAYDSACDNDNTILQVVPFETGQAVGMLRMIKVTLTAQNQSLFCPFPNPIRLARNSTVIFYNSFTVGVGRIGATVFGYTVEPFENL